MKLTKRFFVQDLGGMKVAFSDDHTASFPVDDCEAMILNLLSRDLAEASLLEIISAYYKTMPSYMEPKMTQFLARLRSLYLLEE